MCDCENKKRAEESALKAQAARLATGDASSSLNPAPVPTVQSGRVRQVMAIAEAVVQGLEGVRIDYAVEALQMAIPLVANQRR